MDIGSALAIFEVWRAEDFSIVALLPEFVGGAQLMPELGSRRRRDPTVRSPPSVRPGSMGRARGSSVPRSYMFSVTGRITAWYLR